MKKIFDALLFFPQLCFLVFSNKTQIFDNQQNGGDFVGEEK